LSGKRWIGISFLVGIVGITYWWGSEIDDNSPTGTPMAVVKVPPLSSQGERGQTLFLENCATCHGPDAAGRYGIGPPLVNQIYRPSHHSDIAFIIASLNGVRQHHWNFGNMPPISGITERDVKDIIVYLRSLQQANAIE
jgi:mono/diheme cytochrome c family protein